MSAYEAPVERPVTGWDVEALFDKASKMAARIQILTAELDALRATVSYLACCEPDSDAEAAAWEAVLQLLPQPATAPSPIVPVSSPGPESGTACDRYPREPGDDVGVTGTPSVTPTDSLEVP